MSMKEWVRQMQPVQLYVILVITILFYIVELTVSHITHSLTLLMDSYQMLCNIFALSGCLISMKYGSNEALEKNSLNKAESVASIVGEELKSDNPSKCQDNQQTETSKAKQNNLKNTFGWARIDILSMLFCCVFLASVCFSIFIEAIQTLVHIGHQDEMHHPIPILCIGCCGLIINGLSYLLIGGFTFHQGSFLYVTASGDVILNKVVVGDVRSGARRLSSSRNVRPSYPSPRERQGFQEIIRDISGCVLVMLCSILVYFSDKFTAKYIDPIMSLVSVALITILSYPYMRESCFILLQTIPDTIDIESLRTQLLAHFPEIVNVHDFHVWQLTASKIISTVHIIFQNPKVYKRIMNDVNQFFLENGITQVTIQPEFYTKSVSTETLTKEDTPMCLVACQCETCKLRMCCDQADTTLNLKSSRENIDKSLTKASQEENINKTAPEVPTIIEEKPKDPGTPAPMENTNVNGNAVAMIQND